jgi:hypothetical protein
MSVMTPEQLRNGGSGVDMRGRPTAPMVQQLQQAPVEPERPQLQRQAVIDQLGTQPLPGSQPTASAGGAFARGGQVKQLPGMAGDRAQQVVGLGASAVSSAAGVANPYGMVGSYLGNKLKPKEEMPEFGGEYGDLTDQYGRRFEGAGPGVAGGAAKGAGYGAVAGPMGAAVGAGVGALIGAATKNATSAYSDFRVEDAAQIVRDAYKKYLGREASDDEVMGNLVGQGWDPKDGDRWVGEKGLRGKGAVLDQIRDSPEAQAFRARGSVIDQLGTGGEPTVETSVPAGAERISGSASGAAPAGGGRGKLEGFGGMTADGRSKLEASDSPKYQVARVLQNYPSTPEGLRQALPELQKLGLGDVSIGGSKGDKLTFSGQTDPRFNGVTTFDVIRAAGNGGEAWVWQGEGGAAPAAAGGGANAAGSVDLGNRAPQPDVLDGDTLARLRAELERIMSGQPDRQALLSQMGGANG